MKRPHRAEDGKYHIHGKMFSELFGSRTQVMNGTAFKTPGELTKKDLVMNKWGRIVSKKKHMTAKKEKRLQKYGYFAKKGKFGFVRRKTAKRQGGRTAHLSPGEFSGGKTADLLPAKI
jgi:hypothetical protein